MPPAKKKEETETKAPKSTTSETTPPEEEFIDSLESEIDELFKDIEELEEPDKNAFLLYLAQRVTKYGFAVIKITEQEELSSLKLFNSAQLFNDNGSSKNLRLDTLKKLQEAKTRKREHIETGDCTAEELCLAILNRAGLPESTQKLDLVKFFSRSLLINIPNPLIWQNPFWDTERFND